MVRHPDGSNITKELIASCALVSGAKILDMGAGDGDSVALLRSMGYDAIGIDKKPSGIIIEGDITALPFEGEYFDAVLSECTFSVCGDTASAFREAYRVLKPGGTLMLSDVYFRSEDPPCLSLGLPASLDGWDKLSSGFQLVERNDRTAVWTEYIIDCVWRGADMGDCGYFKAARKAKGGYFIAVYKKV